MNGMDSTLLIAAGGGGGLVDIWKQRSTLICRTEKMLYREPVVPMHKHKDQELVLLLGQGGSSGNGGTGGVSNHPGAGGAGFLTDGTMGQNTAGYHAFAGVSFSSGFIGGDGRGKPNGGFGGGGSTSHGGGGGGATPEVAGSVDSSWWCRLGPWWRWRRLIQLRDRSK